MDITTKHRSHWVAADGTRHASLRTTDPDGRIVDRGIELRPVVNIEEMREYADLGDRILPCQGMSSQYWARRLVEHPKALDDRQIALMVAELTDDIPRYHAQWRDPFIALRNRRPGVDGQQVVEFWQGVSKAG